MRVDELLMENEPKPSPYVVVVDTREQSPFLFAHPLKITASHYRQISTERGTLRSGDYSIVGLTDLVAIERKSLADLYGTLGHGRKRFEAELKRLAELEFSAVVVEAELSTALTSPPPFTRLSPFSVMQSALSWSIKYPKTHWWFCPGRDGAEAVTAWLLERFWRKAQEAIKCETIKSEG